MFDTVRYWLGWFARVTLYLSLYGLLASVIALLVQFGLQTFFYWNPSLGGLWLATFVAMILYTPPRIEPPWDR